MFDSKKLAASCAAVASLAMLGLSGTAMAVETPTTADTATAPITLNAAEGNTLAGHTFTFYRLGSYGDITAGTSGTDVKSLTVNKIDDTSDKWIQAANTKAGITDLQGFDAAGDLAHLGKDGEPTGTVQGRLREAAKQLAATASTAGTDGKALTVTKTVTGSGATMTVADLPNGLYLIVDSAGSPMIVGTPIQGSKTLNGVTLGALTIKSKTVSIDKKVSHDRKDKATLIDSKAGNTASSASWNVGGTAYFPYQQYTQVDPITHNSLARDGYTFTGWSKDMSHVTGDMTVQAQYRPVRYTVDYDANGGTGSMPASTLTYDSPQALSAIGFTKAGYSFTGWNTRKDGSGRTFTDKQTVSNLLTHEGASGTLYAQWTPTPPIVTVIFHVNNGGSDETVKRVWASNNLEMKTIGLPSGWSNSGFAFRGWNLKADGTGVEYEAGETLYGRLTAETTDLYADWNGLQTRLPDTGGILRRGLAGLLHAGGISGGELMFPPPPPSLPRRPGKL